MTETKNLLKHGGPAATAAGSTLNKLKHIANGNKNKLFDHDRPVHEWYRFVLSFPPQIVREYVQRFELGPDSLVLDPFCGTGTTLVECKKMGIPGIGLEAHPMAAFASHTKTSWHVSPNALERYGSEIAKAAGASIKRIGRKLRSLPPDAFKLLLKGSISPLPLHKTLVFLDHLNKTRRSPYFAYGRLALAKSLIAEIGNLHFGPEVGVRGSKDDAPVVESWLANIRQMAQDLAELQDVARVSTEALCQDSRQFIPKLPERSITSVITSPPYPNEKDYTRTTRLETVLLGFANNRVEMRALKQHLLRSNTRNVYVLDDDDMFVEGFPEIQRIAAEIEARRLDMGKTSGFERLYARVTKLYFGGMARHLSELRRVLHPGARLAYVVGDQASYLQVMIRTGQLLGAIAESLGYMVESIDLFRTRLATATRAQLREEVLVLKWRG